jgi:hypothetical protein
LIVTTSNGAASRVGMAGSFLTNPDDFTTVIRGDPVIFHAVEAAAPLSQILGNKSSITLDGGKHRRNRAMMLDIGSPLELIPRRPHCAHGCGPGATPRGDHAVPCRADPQLAHRTESQRSARCRSDVVSTLHPGRRQDRHR